MTDVLPPLIVVDIGGTNLRIATLSDNLLSDMETVHCSTGDPETVIAGYLQKRGLIDAVLCMAIACPVSGDVLTMTNFDWRFSRTELRQNLGLSQLFVINDFHAMSLCVPSMGPADLVKTGGGESQPERTRIICGPGTGMGLGHLISAGDGWIVIPGEGGHGDFAPNSELEAMIWHVMHKAQGHVFIESLLSGPGLERLYQVLCEIGETGAEPLTAAEISQRAVDGSDGNCRLALTCFCEMFGSWCGSLAINAGAFGGVYITGGVIPKFLDFFIASPFRNRFEAKGNYGFYTRAIPTYVITNPIPGLIGTAEYLRGQLIEQGLPLTREPIREHT